MTDFDTGSLIIAANAAVGIWRGIRAMVRFGGGGGSGGRTRTSDPRIMIPLLYQLSYSATEPPSGQYVCRGRRVKPAEENASKAIFSTRHGDVGMVKARIA